VTEAAVPLPPHMSHEALHGAATLHKASEMTHTDKQVLSILDLHVVFIQITVCI